jgi:hypothetical protein
MLICLYALCFCSSRGCNIVSADIQASLCCEIQDCCNLEPLISSNTRLGHIDIRRSASYRSRTRPDQRIPRSPLSLRTSTSPSRRNPRLALAEPITPCTNTAMTLRHPSTLILHRHHLHLLRMTIFCTGPAAIHRDWATTHQRLIRHTRLELTITQLHHTALSAALCNRSSVVSIGWAIERGG